MTRFFDNETEREIKLRTGDIVAFHKLDENNVEAIGIVGLLSTGHDVVPFVWMGGFTRPLAHDLMPKHCVTVHRLVVKREANVPSKWRRAILDGLLNYDGMGKPSAEFVQHVFMSAAEIHLYAGEHPKPANIVASEHLTRVAGDLSCQE